MRWFRPKPTSEQFWMAATIALMLREGQYEVVLTAEELFHVHMVASGLSRRGEGRAPDGSAARVRLSIIGPDA